MTLRPIAAAAGCGLTPWEVDRFPDGELRPAVESVRGDDVYVIQPTGPPANEHLVEMLTAVPVLARALKSMVADDAVVVAPDLGAVKLAERHSALLPSAPSRWSARRGSAARQCEPRSSSATSTAAPP